MTTIMKDDAQLFKQYSDNTDFRRWLSNRVFELAYAEAASAPESEML